MVSLRFVYGLFTDYCEQFKDGYVCLRVVYDFIRVILRWLYGLIRVITSILSVVTNTLRIDTYNLRTLTNCLRFGERYTSWKFEHFFFSYYFLDKNRKDSLILVIYL